MAIGIECKGESYGLLIDAIGEVIKLSVARPARTIRSTSTRGSRASRPVCIGLDGNLLVVLDVDRVLDIGAHAGRRERDRRKGGR